jgi:hypothetical protein
MKCRYIGGKCMDFVSANSGIRRCLSGEGKLPGASLSDRGLVLFVTCPWNITHSKWFLTRWCLSPSSVMMLFRHVPQA